MFLLTKPQNTTSNGLVASYLFDDGAGDVLREHLRRYLVTVTDTETIPALDGWDVEDGADGGNGWYYQNGSYYIDGLGNYLWLDNDLDRWTISSGSPDINGTVIYQADGDTLPGTWWRRDDGTFTATGATLTDYNGVYSANGTYNGQAAYSNPSGKWLFWNTSDWRLGSSAGDASAHYASTTGIPLPGLWYATGGVETAPTMYRGGTTGAPTLTENNRAETTAGVSHEENPLDGTLINFSPTYNITVNGGSFSDATFSPSGTEYGKTKYLSADGNTKVSYWYMMDPEMDGAWYVWASTATEPWMDGYDAEAYTTGDAWDGSYSNSYTVAQGAAQPGPWFADGLEFSGGGAINLPVSDVMQPCLGDVTFAFDYVYKNQVADGRADSLFWMYEVWGSVPNIGLYRWAGAGGWSDPVLRLSIAGTTGSAVTADFPSSGIVWTVGVRRRVVVTIARGGYARLFVDGKYISQVSISGAAGSLTGLTNWRLGANGYDWDGTWTFKGRFRRFEYHRRALTDSEAAAWTGTTDRVAVMPRLPLFAFVPGEAPAAATGAYYYRYLTSLWTEAQ